MALAASGAAELAEVLDRWATLPEAIRRAVLALVWSVDYLPGGP